MAGWQEPGARTFGRSALSLVTQSDTEESQSSTEAFFILCVTTSAEGLPVGHSCQ